MFCPLDVKSAYSLLKSPLRIPEYVSEAKKMGYKALALTDQNIMYGTLDFYHSCLANNIKPLIGINLEMDIMAHNNVILIAKDETGYQNLLKISTFKMSRNKRDPEASDVKFDQVKEELKHLIIIAPFETSFVGKSLQNGMEDEAKLWIEKFKSAADPDSLYLGISADIDQTDLSLAEKFSQKVQLPLLACPQVEYLRQSDSFEKDVLQAIAQGKKLSGDQLKNGNRGGMHFLKDQSVYQQEFEALGLSTAYANADQVIDKVNLKLEFPPTQLPHFAVPAGSDAEAYLKELCETGLKERMAENNISESDQNQYYDRLAHELEVIHRMGFDDYFLIVWDVTNFAHNNKILIGPGRGSAAGSLVAYVLRITDVDPLEYNLLFERFLNEERAQMPDIDLDIPDIDRDKVINYVHQKYGQDKMAQIITFGTFGAKQALRDVGRVMGLNTQELSTWSKAIPRVPHISLREAYSQSQRIKNLVADTQKNKLLFETALSLEGLPRHYSTHAAGVILSDHPLSNAVPLQIGGDGILLSQYAKEGVEEAGLLKMDFLGLRNLSVLGNALRLVKIGYGKELDISKISLDDPGTISLFQKAETTGVFQFESAGIRNTLSKLHPTSFKDIVAVNALYRPGPMENIDEFIARKHGEKAITYPAEGLRPILEETYGIIVYQEQVMLVASAMAGFSLGQADMLRRAMSKKKGKLIAEMKPKFISGAQEKGFSQEEAEKVYAYISHFANYGFNKSHAVAYSKMAFELAYIKCHYPAAFYAALMNSVLGSAAKMKEYVAAARKQKVAIQGPDINISRTYFIIHNQKVYFGLGAIKSLRRDFIQQIVTERSKNGRYRSLHDFMDRIEKRFKKKENIEPLIYSGAFDEFASDRGKLLSQLNSFLSEPELDIKDKKLRTILVPKSKENYQKLSLDQKLDRENYYLGTYISAHPTEQFASLNIFYDFAKVMELQPGQQAECLLYLKQIREVRTKKGDLMAFLSCSDKSGDIDVTVFPRLYKQVKNQLLPGKVYLIKGKTEERYGLSLIANQIIAADSISIETFYLRLRKDLRISKRQELFRLLQENRGSAPVIIYDEKTGERRLLSRNQWIKRSPYVLGVLRKFLGEDNVVLK